MNLTESRKNDHVRIVLDEKVEHSFSGGFDEINFLHYALPELDFHSIDLTTVFLGKKLAAPFMITGMTGGYTDAKKINDDLAVACEQEGIVFALGSQRAMLEVPRLKETYDVKKAAPQVFLCGNLGGFQLKNYSVKKISDMLDDVEADALCIHLNPLQEASQPEGDLNWLGVLAKIRVLCDDVGVPVIAKETGAGINGAVAKELARAGVKAIDVSGAGGTSWSAVESYRGEGVGKTFWDWGVPTAEALTQCVKAVKIPVIASGGVRSGLDVAKAIRLGASIGGGASPFIKAQHAGGCEGVLGEVKRWKRELQTAMFLTRSRNLAALKKAKLLK